METRGWGTIRNFNDMVFTVQKLETPTFGDKLKKARESLGWPLARVSQGLNVQIKFLEKLEKNDWENLPAEVFLIGFLRRYAKILGWAEDNLISEFKREFNLNERLVRIKKKNILPSLRPARVFLTPKILSYALGVLIFFIVVGYLLFQLNHLIGAPPINNFEPPSDFSTDQKTIRFSGQTTPEAQLTINGGLVYINKDGKFSQEINLSAGLNVIKVESRNRFGKTTSLIRQIMLRAPY